jgi:hypothetical protein
VLGATHRGVRTDVLRKLEAQSGPKSAVRGRVASEIARRLRRMGGGPASRVVGKYHEKKLQMRAGKRNLWHTQPRNQPEAGPFSIRMRSSSLQNLSGQRSSNTLAWPAFSKVVTF